MDDILKITVKALDEKKGEDIKVLDFRNKSSIADYFVICHANNLRLMNALVDNVIEKLEEAGYVIKNVEGDDSSGWLLVDAYDVIVHVFMNEQRHFYGLEKLWLDIPMVNIDEII